MEEQTAEEVQNAETADEAADETAPAEETVETTEADVSDKPENELVKLKGKIMHADEELETEFGEEEGEIWREMEEVHGVRKAKSDAKAAGEFEYVKKQKPVPKIRRVDMAIHYPDESESSLDEKKLEKKAVEAEAEGFGQDFDDSEYLIDPNKDYSVVDPSFLDEFLSSEEEQYYEAGKLEVERRGEAFEEVEEEEDDFQQEIYVQPPDSDREPSDRVYDQICDLETPLSSDESFKVPRFRFIPRRRSYPTQGFREEDNKWLSRTQSVHSTDIPSTALLNLMENIAPALKKTLLEIATYQPSNAVYYMTHSLLHKAKEREEVGLEPDPHLIQMIVDGQKKKKKPQAIPIIKKDDEIFLLPHPESHVSTPQKEVKPDVPITDDDDDDEDPSHMHRFQRKYRKAKKKEVTEEKAKRINLSRKTMLPGICLGPTSLPLAADTPSKIKSGSSKA